PDLKTFLVSHLKGWISKEIKEEETSEWGSFTLASLRQLLAMVDELDDEGAFKYGPYPVVLSHWDLEPRNIMVENSSGIWRICGIIDWDDSLALPRPLARRPPDWIWEIDEPPGYTGYLDNDHHPNDSISEEGLALKAYFDAKADAALPNYLEDAYGSGRWLRRIWTFARSGADSCWYIGLIKKLPMDWEARPKPAIRPGTKNSLPSCFNVITPVQVCLTYLLFNLRNLQKMAPHVCIIGGGVSGLRCATVLLEHSYEVTIIEARNRLGGRVRYEQSPSCHATLTSCQIAQSDQMGTPEVDITGYNPIIELAKETGTPFHRWKENTLLVDSEGHLLDRGEANKALKQVWEILEAAIEHSTKRSEKILPSASLYSFFQSWCDWHFESGYMTEREVELVLGMSQMWGAYVGDRVELQSLKFFYLEDCIEGGKHKNWLLATYD
ncbi:MAG: hypothetical protein Q9181_006892, partial [Wetmoreana brouardii]